MCTVFHRNKKSKNYTKQILAQFNITNNSYLKSAKIKICELKKKTFERENKVNVKIEGIQYFKTNSNSWI